MIPRYDLSFHGDSKVWLVNARWYQGMTCHFMVIARYDLLFHGDTMTIPRYDLSMHGDSKVWLVISWWYHGDAKVWLAFPITALCRAVTLCASCSVGPICFLAGWHKRTVNHVFVLFDLVFRLSVLFMVVIVGVLRQARDCLGRSSSYWLMC